MEDGPANGDGLTFDLVMDALHKRGIVFNTNWDYEPEIDWAHKNVFHPWNQKNLKELRDIAKEIRVWDWDRHDAKDVARLKELIDSNRPVALAVETYQDAWTNLQAPPKR